ncbi:MAG: sugar phosphate isomerase/epimerase family protein [Planctomycetota bacterium]|nr:sugar phosphate isomerase/epimerase family protein [Planctomycetota bacterium]
MASSEVFRREPRLKKSLKIGMVQVGETLVEKFRILKELGYDGVELDSPSSLDWREVLRAKAETGLEIPGVVCSTHWGKPLSAADEKVRQQGIEGIETALRDCRLYGGTTVLVVPGVCKDGVTYEQAWDRSTAALRQLLPLAEELGVRIAFENVWNDFITDADEAVRYVDQFESPWVGWYFDTGNIVRYGRPPEWVKKLGSRTIKVDIKDYSRALMKKDGVWAGFRCKIGNEDSSVEWAETMQELDRVGYRGWGSAEVSGGGRERLADIAKRMDDVSSR